ncbi:hypothetical protein GCM10010840_36940 [Deinococcus aerolatus]|uniref:Major facilitator superfamily MFS_1 n=2 Tax=Deinococcus aerolatus TaxID=522487 RepID=A0ABQ2GH58_9DEIO|nr:hypothetical protein GCM10010840_36940 [Deinococcus aerolatus]
MLLLAVGPMGAFFLVTLFMQHILAYSRIQTGLAWLPFAVGIAVSSGVASKLVSRFAPRAIGAAGMLIAAGGMFWLSTTGVSANYALNLLPGIFLTAFRFGLGFMPLTLTAVRGVREQESGIASALLNAAQQLGVALGLALLSTVAVVARASDALVQRYSIGLMADALILVVAAIITALVINARPQSSGEESTPTH